MSGCVQVDGIEGYVWVPRRNEIGAVWGRFLLNYIVVLEKGILILQNSL